MGSLGPVPSQATPTWDRCSLNASWKTSLSQILLGVSRTAVLTPHPGGGGSLGRDCAHGSVQLSYPTSPWQPWGSQKLLKSCGPGPRAPMRGRQSPRLSRDRVYSARTLTITPTTTNCCCHHCSLDHTMPLPTGDCQSPHRPPWPSLQARPPAAGISWATEGVSRKKLPSWAGSHCCCWSLRQDLRGAVRGEGRVQKLRGLPTHRRVPCAGRPGPHQATGKEVMAT